MRLYPSYATEALEFERVRLLVLEKCRTEIARTHTEQIRFHTRLDHVRKALDETNEYTQIIRTGDYFPNDFTDTLKQELRLLTIPGGVLEGRQLLSFLNLALTLKRIHQWFRKNRGMYPALESLIADISYHPEIGELIDAVVDEQGTVRDTASPALGRIRNEIEVKRKESRRIFSRILKKMGSLGYLAEISEGFLNGRRTLAIAAEHKRIVKGILHGESESQKIVFIEPEETTWLNNEIVSLEHAERQEVHRILAALTRALSVWQPALESYYKVCGFFDFIRAKALLAIDMQAVLPRLSPHPGVQLVRAYHPLLWLRNIRNGKETQPLDLTLDREQRILIISGPNAGGKTVSMKTVGLLQLMLQSGLLIPADERSEFGIFRQIMVHIGDTQSIEQELSTYSAHLRDMKYFMEFADGKTLFCIDELGSGSDPVLGGAFAEAIVESLAKKRAMGIITTHYPNLKAMAGKIKGIFNGAMSFDEEELLPLYRLVTGRPGSSYTFAIAQRSGLPAEVIDRARQLTGHKQVKLDKLLHETEKTAIQQKRREDEIGRIVQENEKLRHRYERLIDKETRRQQLEDLKLRNEIKKEELEYLRDMERKFRQIIQDWKKSENKQEVILSAEKVLSRKKQLRDNTRMAKKADRDYIVTGMPPAPGGLVRHRQNHQIGVLVSMDGKRAVVRIGRMPFHVDITEWVGVQKITH